MTPLRNLREAFIGPYARGNNRHYMLDGSLMLLLNNKVDAKVADYPFCRVAEFRYQDKGFFMVKTVSTCYGNFIAA